MLDDKSTKFTFSHVLHSIYLVNDYVDIIGDLALHDMRLRRVLGRVYVDGLSRGVRHKIEAWLCM